MFWKSCERGGHRFEGRYDVIPSGQALKTTFCSPEEVTAILKANSKQIYVRDVCARCGKTIEREKTTTHTRDEGK